MKVSALDFSLKRDLASSTSGGTKLQQGRFGFAMAAFMGEVDCSQEFALVIFGD